MSATLVEIKQLIIDVKQQLAELNIEERINNAAAKVINDINEKLDKCECVQKVLDKLNNTDIPKDTANIDKKDKGKATKGRYTFPNFDVGNESLGQGKNPKPFIWPPQDLKKLDK